MKLFIEIELKKNNNICVTKDEINDELIYELENEIELDGWDLKVKNISSTNTTKTK